MQHEECSNERACHVLWHSYYCYLPGPHIGQHSCPVRYSARPQAGETPDTVSRIIRTIITNFTMISSSSSGPTDVEMAYGKLCNNFMSYSFTDAPVKQMKRQFIELPSSFSYFSFHLCFSIFRALFQLVIVITVSDRFKLECVIWYGHQNKLYWPGMLTHTYMWLWSLVALKTIYRHYTIYRLGTYYIEIRYKKKQAVSCT